MPLPILIVEDNTAVRGVLAKFFRLDGFEIVEAESGREALTYLRAGGAACAILLDLRMPRMDGWAFRREQRNDPGLAQIPVIVFSGADEEDRLPELDAAAVFRKPVSPTEVIAAVRELCGLPR